MLPLAVLLAAAHPAPPPAIHNRGGTLTKLLNSHNFVELTKVLNNPPSLTDMHQSLDWERDGMFRGASMFVSLRYAADIWQVGAAQKDDQIKQAAALAMLFAFAADTIDGKRCKDVSAPGHRIEQFATALRPIAAYLRSLPTDTRRKLVDLTIKLDARTMNSPSRRSDWFLCSGGIDEIQYGLSHGSQKQVPTKPGYLGQTVEVDTTGYKPEFLPDEASAKPVADERARLMSTIAPLAGL